MFQLVNKYCIINNMENKERLLILFQPSAGICNRLKCMFSVIKTHPYSTEFFIHWPTSHIVDATFNKLFHLQGYKINEVNDCDFRRYINVSPPVSMQWRLNVDGEELPNGFTKAFPKEDTNLEYIDFEFHRIPLDIQRRYSSLIGHLRPSEDVQTRINSIHLPENTIGIHIRHNKAWEDAGRSNISLEEFFSCVDSHLTPYNKIFIATPSEYIYDAVSSYYGERVISLPDKDYSSSRDAVAELFLLSKCKVLVGTFGSTFSEFSWYLSGCSQSVTIVGAYDRWNNG